MHRRGGRKVNSLYARPSATIATASPVSNSARSHGRQVASTSSAPASAERAPAPNNIGLSSDSERLLMISEQMKFFAEGLATAQRSCDSTQALFLEKCDEQNRLIAEHRAASLAESKALTASLQQQFQHSAPAFVWKSRGNEANHKYNCGTLNNYIEISTAQESDDWDEAKRFVREGIKSTILRQKCIKMADASPAGWGLVEEYLSNALADNDDDDKKIRRCETAALEKRKRRLEKPNSNKRGRNGNNNNNNNNNANSNGKGGGKGKATATVTEASPTVVNSLDPLMLTLLQNQLQSFMPATLAAKSPPKKLGPCFVCQGDHLQNDCPYVRAQRAAYQQHMAASLGNAPGNSK